MADDELSRFLGCISHVTRELGLSPGGGEQAEKCAVAARDRDYSILYTLYLRCDRNGGLQMQHLVPVERRDRHQLALALQDLDAALGKREHGGGPVVEMGVATLEE